jgi:hypothetical protein
MSLMNFPLSRSKRGFDPETFYQNLTLARGTGTRDGWTGNRARVRPAAFPTNLAGRGPGSGFEARDELESEMSISELSNIIQEDEEDIHSTLERTDRNRRDRGPDPESVLTYEDAEELISDWETLFGPYIEEGFDVATEDFIDQMFREGWLKFESMETNEIDLSITPSTRYDDGVRKGTYSAWGEAGKLDEFIQKHLDAIKGRFETVLNKREFNPFAKYHGGNKGREYAVTSEEPSCFDKYPETLGTIIGSSEASRYEHVNFDPEEMEVAIENQATMPLGAVEIMKYAEELSDQGAHINSRYNRTHQIENPDELSEECRRELTLLSEREYNSPIDYHPETGELEIHGPISEIRVEGSFSVEELGFGIRYDRPEQ